MNRFQINYSQCWEDSQLVLECLHISPGDIVLSIGSGGDNSLSLLSECPATLYVVDFNPYQIYLIELKLQAITNLEVVDLIGFLGYQPSKNRILTYQKIAGNLSSACKAYWDCHVKQIEKGVVHIGKFESYLNLFRQKILPFLASKSKRAQLLKEKSEPEQQQFIDKKWNNWRWNLVFNMFFTEKNLKNKGRGDGMFNHNPYSDVAAHYKAKVHEAMLKPSWYNNYYMDYIFNNKYTSLLPDYLASDAIKNIKNSCTEVKLKAISLLDFLKESESNYFSKMNLSDVFEPLSLEQTKEIFEQIVRTAQNNATVIFWNNLVDRDVPADLWINFERQDALEHRLVCKDRVFFYNCMRIYKVIK